MIAFNPKDTPKTQLDLVIRKLSDLTPMEATGLVNAWMEATRTYLNANLELEHRNAWAEIMQSVGKHGEYTEAMDRSLVYGAYAAYNHPECGNLSALARLLLLLAAVRYGHEFKSSMTEIYSLFRNAKYAKAFRNASITYMVDLEKRQREAMKSMTKGPNQ